MRTTLRLNDQVMAEAKRLAVDTHRTLTQVVEDSLRDMLARAKQSGRRKKISLPTSCGSGTQPGIDITSNSAVLDAMDEADAYSGR